MAPNRTTDAHRTALDRDSEMVRIVELLAETYTDGGVALVLGSRHTVVSPALPVIETCKTTEGRRAVLEWAESLTGMVAT